MSEFKPLEQLEFPHLGTPLTEENLYWKKLGVSFLNISVLSKFIALLLYPFISSEYIIPLLDFKSRICARY